MSHNCLLVNVEGCPSCIDMASRPFPKALHSNIELLAKLGMSKIGAIHETSFKDEKACSVASFHTKALFFNKVFKRVEIHP
jgi:hypothetical protein